MQMTEEQWAKIYGQYLDKTADVIQNRVDDMQIVFYFLKDYELKGLEFETILYVDGQWEITFREIDSDEGGNTAPIKRQTVDSIDTLGVHNG